MTVSGLTEIMKDKPTDMSRLDFLTNLTQERKEKIDEDEMKMKLFQLNRRSYLKEVRDKEYEKVFQLKALQRRVKTWIINMKLNQIVNKINKKTQDMISERHLLYKQIIMQKKLKRHL